MSWEERCRALEEQNRALQEADQRKDQFLAVLAHELRNLLAPIGYAVDLMQISAEDPAVVRECCAVTDRQLNQMVRLVDDLLDVSRISRGKMDLRCERVPLAEVVARAVEISRPWIEGNQQTLHVTVPAEPILLNADATRLAQVVANLLNNASKYSEAGGEIRLAVEPTGAEALIRVKDHGAGIPPDDMGRIFDMFSQLDPPPERSPRGLGIGLGLAKGIVELHSGRIVVRSDGPRQGSEFIIRLPCLSGAEPHTEWE
jgi:signal transduction histidine kinase